MNEYSFSKNYHFNAKEHEFSDRFPSSISELRFRTGFNIGNWLFTSGVHNLISGKNNDVIKCWSSPFENSMENFGQEISAQIINVSNWIHPDQVNLFKAFTEQIKSVKTPTYLLGIGAQVRTDRDRKLLMQHKGVFKDFFSAIADSGGNFTVRGSMTADIIEEFGLERPFISGCPSMLGHATPCVSNYDEYSDRIIFHGDEWIYKYALPENGTFIDQTSLFQLCFAGKNLQRLRAMHSVLPENIEHLSSNSKKYLIPCNLHSWSSIIRKHTISIGTRIHGTLIALLNEKPAFLFHHDSRTKELAELYGIPTAPLPENVSQIALIEQAISESREFDFSKIQTNIESIKREFQEWIIQNQAPFQTKENQLPRSRNLILQPSIHKPEALVVRQLRRIHKIKRFIRVSR